MYKENKVEKIVHWIKKNKTSFFTLVGFIVGISLLTIFIYSRLQMLNTDSSEQLSIASNYISAGKIDQGLSIIDDIIAKYPRTYASYRARLMKANYLVAQKKHDEAEQLVKVVIQEARPDTIKPLAYPILITIYDEKNNLEQAIATSQEFLAKYKTNFLAVSVMDNMARLYELSGNKVQAQNVYKDIVDSYPHTIYASKAKSKLQ